MFKPTVVGTPPPKITCTKCGATFNDHGQPKKTCPACQEAVLMPDGLIADVKMHLRPGGFDHPRLGLEGGYATCNASGAIYLKCHFEVMEGPYKKRTFGSLIGVHTPKGAWWGNKGRSTLRRILDSAYGLSATDYSATARLKRKLDSLATFDGLEFKAQIGRSKGPDEMMRNDLKGVVTIDDPPLAEDVSNQEPQPASQVGSSPLPNTATANVEKSTGAPPLWLTA